MSNLGLDAAYRGFMAPKAKLSVVHVTTSAVGVVDRNGLAGLSMSAVAVELGVATSALYTYCGNVDGLYRLVAVQALDDLTNAVQAAATGKAGSDALLAMVDAWHDFALTNPGQFAATLRPPPGEDRTVIEAMDRLVDIFALVFAATGLEEPAATRSARQMHRAVHGCLAIDYLRGTTESGAADLRDLVEALVGAT